MKWFLKCIRNYVNFTGRARRKEYWNFVLFTFILMALASLVDFLVFWPTTNEWVTTLSETPDSNLGSFWLTINNWTFMLLAICLMLPQLAVSVRRLHDIGKSGYHLLWFSLAYFALIIVAFTSMGNMINTDIYSATSIAFMVTLIIGYLGLLVWSVFFLVWFLTNGNRGENKYGPDPKEIER